MQVVGAWWNSKGEHFSVVCRSGNRIVTIFNEKPLPLESRFAFKFNKKLLTGREKDNHVSNHRLICMFTFRKR